MIAAYIVGSKGQIGELNLKMVQSAPSSWHLNEGKS